MLKNIANKVKMLWKSFFMMERKKRNTMIYYVVGLLLVGIIVSEGFYLWKDQTSEIEQIAEKKPAAKEISGMVIGQAQRDNLELSNREMQGIRDGDFETAIYGTAKNIISRNTETKLSREQFHAGKQSLQIVWGKGQNKSVQLMDSITVQKNKYYKIGLWISSEKNSQLNLRLANTEEVLAVAEVGIVANEKNKFRYYEYNFLSPLDASGLEFSAASSDQDMVFIDEIKLLALDIETEEELSSIKSTSRGISHGVINGERQTLHSENSDALSFPRTLIGQIFSPGVSDLVEASFFLVKKGDGGVGEYALEIREFNENTQLMSTQKIAVKNFSAKDVDSEIKFFPIVAKLEVGKKYWIGINNGAVKVNEKNYLALGQVDNGDAYAAGKIFLQKGENKFFTEEKDLYFTTSYGDPMQSEGEALSYGETLYDLGQGRKRLEQSIDAASGSNILDLYAQKNISSDKTKAILLNGKEAYVVYKIKANQKNIKSMMLGNFTFNNNIHISLSADGAQWAEIFSDNSGKPGQNSGKIDVQFKKDVQEVFIKIKKNGEGNAIFFGGYAILDLVDQNYAK